MDCAKLPADDLDTSMGPLFILRLEFHRMVTLATGANKDTDGRRGDANLPRRRPVRDSGATQKTGRRSPSQEGSCCSGFDNLQCLRAQRDGDKSRKGATAREEAGQRRSGESTEKGPSRAGTARPLRRRRANPLPSAQAGRALEHSFFCNSADIVARIVQAQGQMRRTAIAGTAATDR